MDSSGRSLRPLPSSIVYSTMSTSLPSSSISSLIPINSTIPVVPSSQYPSLAHTQPIHRTLLRTWICTDGKQRLSSIAQFRKGKFAIKDASNQAWWFCDANPAKRSTSKHVFSEEAQQEVLELEIQVSSYSELTLASERRVFIKVQAGTALTAAEKTSAISGPCSDWARKLANKFCSPNDPSSFTKGRVSRRSDSYRCESIRLTFEPQRMIQGASPAAITSMMVAISTTFETSSPKAPTSGFIHKVLSTPPPSKSMQTEIVKALQTFRRLSVLAVSSPPP